MQTGDGEVGVLHLGDVALRSGETLQDARLVYKTYGHLNARGDNCILLPTYYTGTHRSYACLVGHDRTFDPARYFIVIPNTFGNGESSSPSRAASAAERVRFPHVSAIDNVLCQRRLLDALGVRRVALVSGWSLGGVLAYFWAAMFPEMVDNLVPICGAARCWPLNGIFLDGLAAALKADSSFLDGTYASPPTKGLTAFARVYAGWAYSPAFFRDGLYRTLGYKSPEEVLDGWTQEHLAWDACDLLAMLRTWRRADIGDLLDPSDFRAALRRIVARTVIVPCTQDRYFTMEENEIEADCISGARIVSIRSPYGHCAGAPGRFPGETRFIQRIIRKVLAAPRRGHA